MAQCENRSIATNRWFEPRSAVQQCRTTSRTCCWLSKSTVAAASTEDARDVLTRLLLSFGKSRWSLSKVTATSSDENEVSIWMDLWQMASILQLASLRAFGDLLSMPALEQSAPVLFFEGRQVPQLHNQHCCRCHH